MLADRRERTWGGLNVCFQKILILILKYGLRTALGGLRVGPHQCPDFINKYHKHGPGFGLKARILGEFLVFGKLVRPFLVVTYANRDCNFGG